ncbi:MAG: hypothetical protein ACQEQI_04885 [Bacillota bacterium]
MITEQLNDNWLGMMQIVEVNLEVPQIVKEVEEFLSDLGLEPIIGGGIISDHYLIQHDIITTNKSSDLDIFLSLDTDLIELKEELVNCYEVTKVTEIDTEKIFANYSEELVSQRLTFKYQGYQCDLLFCQQPRTKIWDFDLTFRQFMYWQDKVYATYLALKDCHDQLLRVLNPVNSLVTLQRVLEFQQRYNFKVKRTTFNLLLDYIDWREAKEGVVVKELLDRTTESVLADDLAEYYFRWLSQKKSHGRALLTYLLLTQNYRNSTLTDLAGNYQIEYNSNLNYKRFISKGKDLQFKIETEVEDKKELSTQLNWTNCRRLTTLLEELTAINFQEFITGKLNEERLKCIYRWHSPKLGKILSALEDFIVKLDLEYYQNYALKLCTQLKKLFNSRGPSSLKFRLGISQQAKDLLAISTNQNWTSCLELPLPDNQRNSAARIAANLHPTTMVAYISESNSEEWLGRVIIRLLQDGNLAIEKYYGEPILKEILIKKVKEIAQESGYQFNNSQTSQSCGFVEWKPYSDQGRVVSRRESIYYKYDIDYSQSKFVTDKLNRID